MDPRFGRVFARLEFRAGVENGPLIPEPLGRNLIAVLQAVSKCLDHE